MLLTLLPVQETTRILVATPHWNNEITLEGLAQDKTTNF